MMKNSHIIRKVDDLGRILIPNTIRKELEINEGDYYEFHYDRWNGTITIKPMKEDEVK